MNSRQKKIAQYTWKLQTQTMIPLWSIASEFVIHAASQNNTPKWGTKTKKIYRLIFLSKKIKLSDFMIVIVGFYQAFSIWKKVKKKVLFCNDQFEKVFAGFGASSEDHIYQEIKQKSRQPWLYINWINYVGMNQLNRPTLFQIISELCKNAFGHTAKFKKTLPEIQAYEIDFLTVCAKNIGLYSFFCAYWKIAKQNGINEVIFLVPDMPAFACVTEQIKTTFTQHGLIAFGILMPKLQRMNVLTETEEHYFKHLFPDINIVKINYNLHINKNKNDTIIILSPNTFFEERLRVIKPFIQWCGELGVKIVIRPTNKVTQSELSLLRDKFPNCIMDNIEESMHHSLETWQPKFVAAWSSTGLAVALENGVLPISFCDPSENHLQYMIYPFNNRVLFWSRDKEILNQALKSNEIYSMQVGRLQNVPRCIDAIRN